MKKTAVFALLLGALALVVATIMFQWRYDEYVQDLGLTKRVVKIRTNRFTGTAQTFSPTLGWMTMTMTASSSLPLPSQPEQEVVAVTTAAPQAAPTPCPTPDPKDPYWHYGRPACP